MLDNTKYLPSQSHSVDPAHPTRMRGVGTRFKVLKASLATNHSTLATAFVWPVTRFLLPIFLAVTCGLFPVTCLQAQTGNATISGRVTDPRGAVVPHTIVEAIQEDTNVKTTTQTNDDGLFYFASLPPASYRIVVSKDGFKQVIQGGLVLHTQDSLTLNFALELGSMSESITVNGEATNESPAVSTVIDRQLVEEAPLNGRSLQTLFELTPGVVLNAGGTSGAAYGAGFSVNGQRPTSNYLMVDGASENIFAPPQGGTNLTGASIATSASGGTNGLLPIDAVEEYRIQTSTYSAAYGRTPGGQIQVKTRSGTNEFHGSLFEYFRNQALDATDWFVKYKGLNQPALRLNDFGGTFGGAIIKDRVFVFVAHETLLMHQPQTYSTEVPNSRTLASVAPVFQPFVAGYPIGNDQMPAGDGVSDLFSQSYSNVIADHTTSIRIDVQASKSNRAFVRVNYAPSDFDSQRLIEGNTHENIHTYTAGVTSQLTSRLTNELTVNYSRDHNLSSYTLRSVGGNDPRSFTRAVVSAVNPNNTDFYFYGDQNWTGLSAGANATDGLWQVNVLDGMSAAIGRHTLAFGGDFLRKAPQVDPINQASLAAGETTLSNLQTGIADQAYYQAFGSNPRLHLTNLSLYVQDTWRVHNNVTFDYGVRWEYNPPPTVRSPGLPQLIGDPDNPQAIRVGLTTSGTYNASKDNFAPRLGFAATVRDSQKYGVTIRGGAGIFFDTGSAATAAAAAQGGYPFFDTALAVSNVPYASVNWSSLHSNTGVSLPAAYLYLTDPNLTLPRTYQWSLTIEQRMGTNTTLSTTYIGNRGSDLIKSDTYFNSVTPYPVPTTLVVPYGSLTVLTNGEQSNYQALQLQVKNHTGAKFEALASYTYAHAIDNGSSDFNQVGAQLKNYRANSDNDIRNVFSSALFYRPGGLQENRFLRPITSGWAISTVAQLQGAAPLSVSSGGSNTNPSMYNGLADVVPGVPVVIGCSACPGGRRLNPSAFANNPGTRDGTSARNGYRLFGLMQWDLAASREWKLWEQGSLNLRVDAFNVINHPNFSKVNTYLPSATFGEATNTYAGTYGGNAAYQASLNTAFSNGGPRSLQLSLKFQF